MLAALHDFQRNVARIRDLHSLQSTLSNQLTVAVDLSDILRTEIVMAVSALDFFVHEVTRYGMLECFKGERPRTKAFDRWEVPMAAVVDVIEAPDRVRVLDTVIRSRHGHLSFQQPDSIADACRLFSDVMLWREVGVERGEPAKVVKQSIKLIVDRRNQIAHEADVDPSYPNQRWPIDATSVEKVLDCIEDIGHAIFRVCRRQEVLEKT